MRCASLLETVTESATAVLRAGPQRRGLSAVRCPCLIEVKGTPVNRWSPYLLSILRIIAAFVYMVHGTQKLFAFPAPFPAPHLPPLFLAGGIIKTFGGSLLLLGLFTRPVALILSGEMAVAYFKFHASQGFWPLLNDAKARCFTASSSFISRARVEDRGALIACLRNMHQPHG
jgi:putative oxidoreductase